MAEPASYTFDALVPGEVIGTQTQTIDRTLLDQWRTLYRGEAPVAGTDVPLGFVSLLLIRAYLKTVLPRPAGNVHVGQQISVIRPPKLDEATVATVMCLGKERRGERRVVKLQTKVRSARGEPLFEGVSTIFWAA